MIHPAPAIAAISPELIRLSHAYLNAATGSRRIARRAGT
jgi:hypothetical protein